MKSKKLKLVLLLFAYLLLNNATLTAFDKQTDGVVFKIQQEKSTDVKLLKIQICSEEIIRVIASPVDSLSSRASLMVEKKSWPPVEWTVRQNEKWIIISTSKVEVKVDSTNGSVSFFEANGKQLLNERSSSGKIITAAEVMGEKTYHIQQLFDSPPDEAFYGLGAHQNNIMNYKGHDVDLWQ